jgi:hypothetical protein
MGVQVQPELWPSWRDWFAPARQPFDVDALPEHHRPLVPVRQVDPSPEVRDTFCVYGRGDRTWLTELEFGALPVGARASLVTSRQVAGHLRTAPDSIRAQARQQTGRSRFVWWPTLLRQAGDEPVVQFVDGRFQPSCHHQVPARTWREARHRLPGARVLAGTFAAGSGPNCFGTVMAAAGVPGAEHKWMLQEPFEEWLHTHARPHPGPGRDREPGVVLLWRDRTGLASHAAVTIGDGHALSKPSQAWFTPRVVWTVRDTIRQARSTGHTLERWLLGRARR